MKREDPEKKKEKAAWQNQPKLHKAVIDPRAKKEAEPAGAKKPAWSGVSLKKAEKKQTGNERFFKCFYFEDIINLLEIRMYAL